MTCDAVAKAIPLYHYGELAPEVEESVEEHLHVCAGCREELGRQKSLAAALDRNQLAPPPSLLAECRHELIRAVYREEAPAVSHRASDPWGLFREAFHSLWHPGIRFTRPAGAVALVALGFFAARFVNFGPGGLGFPGTEAMVSSIRSVQPDNSGRVQIALDETHRRVISGRLEDQNIQRLLLAAAREPDNPGVRVESVELLKDRSASVEVRTALIEAVTHDANPGVRLKALEGLKSFAADPDVRKTLAQVLLKDQNPGVRIQVIDLLIAHKDDATVRILQTLVGKEDNSYVRMRCQNALRDMNASVGTF
ncbi:MAG: HEAT repeat domain-containing protein [Acidobacteriia bacterium]|nr:HEAT repeat domain-containing protein [Terriglobia bacterium]